MTVEEFIGSLEGVKQNGRGWRGKCPAHDDRTPSLSVKEGERGILLRCWAGCSLHEICMALGFKVKDLFYDSDHNLSRDEIQQRQRERERRNRLRHLEYRQRGTQIDATREAERFLASAKNIDIAGWGPQQFDEEMEVIWDALSLILAEKRGIDYVHAV